jgi:hypothetical protein
MKQTLYPQAKRSGSLSILSDMALGVLLVAALFQVATCFNTATRLVPPMQSIFSASASPELQSNEAPVPVNHAPRHEKS